MNPFPDPIDRTVTTPAHLQVKARILALIRDGVWQAGDKIPGEPEIASSLGVSRMTANKAILALVTDGFLSREKGRGTFVARLLEDAAVSTRVAVVIPDDPGPARDDFYFGGLYWPVHDELARRGIPTDLVRLTASLDAAANADAIIAVNPPERAVDELLAFERGTGPVVVLGASWSDYGLSTVDSDNRLGAALAVNHFVDLGHDRILFLGACPESSNTVDRVEGYRTAVKARRLTLHEGDVLMARVARRMEPELEQAIAERLAAPDGPTAIFAAGPYIAMQTLGLAQRLGLAVPERLSIVGYDDPEFLSLAYPAISTVRQPLAQMAEVACQVLFDRLASGDPRAVRKLVDPELIVRGSTDAPRPFHRRNP